MVGRLFFGFLAVVILFLGYELYSIHAGKSVPFNTAAEKIYAPEGADLTVVEFVDFSCPDCRALHPVFMDAVRKDGKVRVILRPVLSSNIDSNTAAYVTEAAAKQGKYVELSDYFLENPLPVFESKEDLVAFAPNWNLDGEKLYNDLQDPPIVDAIKKNYQMMIDLDLNATPTYLIGVDMAVTPPSDTTTVEDFLNWFNQARTSK